ncbi:MAG: CotH kinase family protein [Muribaculaceae bacterium]
MKRKTVSIAVLAISLVLMQHVSAQWGVDSSDTNFRPSSNVSFSETALPIVFLNVDGQTIQKEEKILAKMTIIDNGDGHNYRDTIAHPSQTKNYQGYIALKYRGNSSFYNSSKKPFSVRPLTAADVDAKKAKVVMLDMGKKGDNDWCLLAPWEDRSYVRDLLSFELARPYMSYVPQGRYCEVIVDGWYYGVYILAERPTKGKDRLNLDDPGSWNDDLSGDYHVQVDRTDEPHYYQSKYHPLDGNGNEITNRYITFQYKDFEYDDFMDADFLAKYPHAIDSLHYYIDSMEDALKSEKYADEKQGYAAHLDPLSFIDYQLSTEFCNNIDGYRLSTNLYKYSNEHAASAGLDNRWQMTLWDFNIAYGNASYYQPNSDIWRYQTNDIMDSDEQLVPFWWERLMSDGAYVETLKQRWAEYREGAYTQQNIEEKIDSMVAVLKDAGAISRDNQAWGYQFSNIDYQVSSLKQFIERRMAFIDKGLGYEQSSGGGSSDAEVTVPVVVIGGWNQDVVCEDQANVSGTTTQSTLSQYQGLDKAGFGFYTSDVRAEGALCSSAGTFRSSSANYCIPVATNNALLLKDVEGGLSQGTLTLAAGVRTSKFYVIGTCGDGDSQLSVTLNYADGSTSNATLMSLSDWSTQDGAVSGLGRIATKDGTWSGAAGTLSSSCKFNLFETAILADPQKEVASVTVVRVGSNCPSVLGLSMMFDDSAVDRVPSAASRYIVAVYNLEGINIPFLQPGVNIVRYSDGSVEKVLIEE